MHSQHQCYDAVTIAEHHVLVRDGLCRAYCAWGGKLWMFVSGGGMWWYRGMYVGMLLLGAWGHNYMYIYIYIYTLYVLFIHIIYTN